MITMVLGQILAVCGIALVGMLIRRITQLELTLSCLLSGLLAGLLIPLLQVDTGIRAHNLHDLVFFIILPLLIFEAAWKLDTSLLKRWLGPVLILASIGVLISCFIIALIVYFGIGNSQGFPWIAALLAGAILSATDPIAVINQLHSAKAPEDLTTLFEGESLFNDATAVVLFSIILAMATGTTLEESNNFINFASIFLGGLILGSVLGLISAILVLLLGKPNATHFILVLTAFSSFYIAEELFHFSGIMSVMMSALITRIALKEQSATFLEHVNITWDWAGLVFNSLLFSIMGLVIVIDMFKEQWLSMLIAIIAALIARAISVSICGLLSKPFLYPIPFTWQILLFWGGLRGTIAIALVLALPTELPYWWIVQSMVFGVVIFNVLIQGSTNQFLIKKYT